MRIYALEISESDLQIEPSLQRTLRPHSAPVVVSTIDPTGTLLATGGADGVVKVWDIRGGYTTHTFHGHSGVISALHFFQIDTSKLPAETTPKKRRRSQGKEDGEELDQSASDSTIGFRLASGGEDCKIRIWDLHKRKSVAILESHMSVVRSIDYSREENALVSASRDTTVCLWDARTWKKRSTLAVSEAIESTGFVNDGKTIFTGGERGGLRLWSTSTAAEITEEQSPKTETEAILEVIHFPSLPYLLSVQADQTLFLHSLEPLSSLQTGNVTPPLPLLRRIYGTHDEVIDLAFVGDGGSQLALATNIEDVRIISLATLQNSTNAFESGAFFGADVASLKGHEDIIICMDVDWSGHWLATGAKDNTARLWRLDPESNSFDCYATLTGHAESLGAIALPHGTPQSGSAAYQNPLKHPPAFIVTGSQDKTVKRWAIPSSKDQGKSVRAVYTRKAHDKDINALDTNDRDTLFASASQDRTVKIWGLEDGEVQGVLRGHKRGVWTVRFSPHGTPGAISGAGQISTSRGFVLTGSGDKSVRVWNLADYSCLLTLEGHTNSVLKVVWLPPSSVKDESGQGQRKAAQVASAGGDGLVKVWDLGSGEGESTLDNHTDRVWALAVRPAGKAPQKSRDKDVEMDEVPDEDEDEPREKKRSTTLVSGGGDGVLTFWTDTTQVALKQSLERENLRIEQDQELSNLIFAKNYRDAITLALQLDQPGKLLSIFTSAVENPDDSKGAPHSIMGRKEVDDVLANLADPQIYRLLLRVRDWNTNARTADVAQRVLHTLIKRYPADRLANIKVPEWEGRGGKGKAISLTELYNGIRAYTDRHLRRIEDLVEQSYLLDFTLREMDEVAGSAAIDMSVNGVDHEHESSDFIMVD